MFTREERVRAEARLGFGETGVYPPSRERRRSAGGGSMSPIGLFVLCAFILALPLYLLTAWLIT